MDLNHYRFTSAWRLDEPPDRVYAVLREADAYALWWPQIRGLRRIDEASGEVVARSLLPYNLVLRAAGSTEDPLSRTLEIQLTGDLEGYCRWTVRVNAKGTGTVALFEQEVIMRKVSLRRVALLARPVLRANHAWMMRGGRRGLAHYLRQP